VKPPGRFRDVATCGRLSVMSDFCAQPGAGPFIFVTNEHLSIQLSIEDQPPLQRCVECSPLTKRRSTAGQFLSQKTYAFHVVPTSTREKMKTAMSEVAHTKYANQRRCPIWTICGLSALFRPCSKWPRTNLVSNAHG
jgi:hypothetical protein